MKPQKIKTQIEEVSEWVFNLKYGDIPQDVVELAKLQILDVLAAICAGRLAGVGCKILNSMKHIQPDGPCTNFFSGKKGSLTDTVYLHSALTNSLELDNLVFMGHVGQSAVNVPLSLAEMLKAGSHRMLIALIAAVEVSGRMGGYFALGPQQGHMRSYLHRVASAVATAVLLELNSSQIAKAISIALSMPEYPLFPASFSPETKVLCTSAPSVEGIRAGFLASGNFDSALDILEHPAGFAACLSYLDHPPEVWKYIGETWSLYALSSKMYAACAYAQGPVAAALQITSENCFDYEDIQKVMISAPLTTVAMEAFSVPHLRASITPVNTQFSSCRSVAAALIHKSLTGTFYSDNCFECKADEIGRLSKRITLKTDWQMSIDLIKGIDLSLSDPGEPGIFGMTHTQKTFSILKNIVGSQALLSFRDIPLIMQIPSEDRKYLLKRYWRGYKHRLNLLKPPENKFICHEKDLSKFCFNQSGRVEVTLQNGNVLYGTCRTPPGFAGDEYRKENIERKFFRELSRVHNIERIREIKSLVDKLPETDITKLTEKLMA